MDLSKITVVIPTFNRPNILNRNLEFLDSFNYKLKVLVLDSSTIKKKFNFKKFLNLEIIYKKFKKDIYFAKKIYSGVKTVKTKYLLLCADDDFVIPNCMSLCINFLEKNNEYVACRGYFLQHSKSNKFYQKMNYNLLYKNNFSCENSYSFERCNEYLMGKKSNFFYSIIRTRTSNKIWKFISTKVTGGIALETFKSFLIYYFGKVKVLNYLYSSREATDETTLVTPKYYEKFLSKENIDGIFSSLVPYLGKRRINNKHISHFKNKIQIYKKQRMLTKKKNFFSKYLEIIYKKIYTIIKLKFFWDNIIIEKKIGYYFFKYHKFLKELEVSKKLQLMDKKSI